MKSLLGVEFLGWQNAPGNHILEDAGKSPNHLNSLLFRASGLPQAEQIPYQPLGPGLVLALLGCESLKHFLREFHVLAVSPPPTCPCLRFPPP